MTTAHIKRIIRLGGSLAVTLPPQWAKGRIKPGQEVVVIADGDVRILPVHEGGGQAQYEAESNSQQ